MNDNSQGRNDNGSLAPMIGFALGALVGGTVALLFAPASGERTRRKISDVTRRMTREARNSFDQTREAAATLGADVKSAIDAGREAFRQDGEPVERGPVSRIGPNLAPPPPRTP